MGDRDGVRRGPDGKVMAEWNVPSGLARSTEKLFIPEDSPNELLLRRLYCNRDGV